jgi:hypothetical protein
VVIPVVVASRHVCSDNHYPFLIKYSTREGKVNEVEGRHGKLHVSILRRERILNVTVARGMKWVITWFLGLVDCVF